MCQKRECTWKGPVQWGIIADERAVVSILPEAPADPIPRVLTSIGIIVGAAALVFGILRKSRGANLVPG